MNKANDEMMISLAELISFQSVTGNKTEVTGVLDACLSQCESMGLRTRKVGDLLGYAEAGEGERLIGVLAHLDVVPAGEGWTVDPFRLTVKDGRAYGRGVSDDKGPAVAVVYAVKELLDEGKLKDKRIRIIFGCSEEDGEWEDIEYYKAHEELPECGFTPDAEFPLIYAEKGIANILFTMNQKDSGICELTAGEAPNMVPGYCHAKVVMTDGTTRSVDTTGKSSHASTPEEGINAISLAMKEIDQISSSGEVCCRFADFYQNCFGDCCDGSLMECRFQDEQSGIITFNPGMADIENGEIKLLVDVRYPVTFTAEQVMDQVSQACEKWDVKAELVFNELPMYAEKDSPLAKTLLSAYRDVTGDMTPPLAMGGGTYAKAMDNILAFGPLFPGRECSEHQPDENIIIEDLYKAREIYKLALERL